MMSAPFTPWLTRWSLTPDGEPLRTHSSDLLPVRWNGQGADQAAMLKLARSEEERRGAGLMRFWQGDGAARVLAVSGDGAAPLLERVSVSGPRSLTALVHAGHDEATRLLCAAAPPASWTFAAAAAAREPWASGHGGCSDFPL